MLHFVKSVLTNRPAKLVLAFTVLAIGVGWLRAAAWQAPIQVSFDLVATELPATKAGGLAWSFDLKSLRIADRADDFRHAGRSRLTLLDDGAILKPHATPEAVATTLGVYRHFQDRLLIATPNGENPASNGHHYVVVTEVPGDVAAGLDPVVDTNHWRLEGEWRTRLVLLAGAALLGVAVALAHRLHWSSLSHRERRIAGAVLFLSALGGIALDAQGHWHDLRISADTVTYEVRPGRQSYRSPGYWTFARTVLGEGWNPSASEAFPNERLAPPTLAAAPLIRVAHAQIVFAILGTLLLGLALTGVVPVPIAAGLTALVGNFSVEVADLGDGSRLLLAGVFVMLGGRAAFRIFIRGANRRRAVLTATGAIAGLGAALAAIQFGLPADSVEWITSEGVALPLELCLLAAVTGYVYRGSSWLLVAAATAGSCLDLARPSDGYMLLIVLGLLPLEFRRHGWRRGGLVSAAVATAIVGLALMPNGIQARASIWPSVTLRHALTFATLIADETDRATMPDADSRTYLDRVLPQLAARRAADPRFQGDLIGYFNEVAYNIAWPILEDMNKSKPLAEREAAAKQTAGRVAATILTAKPLGYLRLIAKGLPDAVRGVRVTAIVPWWMLLGTLLLGIWSLSGERRLFVALLCVAALAGTMIPLAASVPIGRLIHPVDALVLLALIVTAAGAFGQRDDAGTIVWGRPTVWGSPAGARGPLASGPPRRGPSGRAAPTPA